MNKLILGFIFLILAVSVNAQTAPIKKKSYVDEQKILDVEASTPRAGYISAPYRKTDGNWYEKTDAGLEQLIIDTIAEIATKYDLTQKIDKNTITRTFYNIDSTYVFTVNDNYENDVLISVDTILRQCDGCDITQDIHYSYADEEDLSGLIVSADSIILKLKDRDSTVSGQIGYKIIRSDFDFTSIPVNYGASIWEIRNIHDLSNSNIIIPVNVILKFTGGKLTNFNTIQGNKTKIVSGQNAIFDTSGTFTGTWDVKESNPLHFGATGDILEDATIAIKNALAVLTDGGRLILTAGKYRVSSQIDVGTNINLINLGGAKIIPESTAGIILNIIGNNVNLEKIHFDGNTIGTTTSANIYCIRTAAGIENLTIIDCVFDNIDKWDGNVLAFHAVYLQGCKNVLIENCKFLEVGGAGVFIKQSSNIKINYSTFNNVGWYNIHCEDGGTNIFVTKCNFSGNKTQGRQWGGSINFITQHDTGGGVAGERTSNCHVVECTFSGSHSYGAVIRIMSVDNFYAVNNYIDSCYSTTAEPLRLIGIDTRGDAVTGHAPSLPCNNIVIVGNTLIAGENGQKGIFITNQFTLDSTASIGYKINSNYILDSGSNLMKRGIIIVGNNGGIKDVIIKDNTLRISPDAGVSLYAIEFDGNDTGLGVTYGVIEGNLVEQMTGTEQARGINIGRYSNQIFLQSNKIKNFSTGVKTDVLATEVIKTNNFYEGNATN